MPVSVYFCWLREFEIFKFFKLQALNWLIFSIPIFIVIIIYYLEKMNPTNNSYKDKENSNQIKRNGDRNLKLDFLYKRLDHTLNHNHEVTKLIYIIDGAVLAFFYFIIKNFMDKWDYTLYWSSFLFLLLAIINYFHVSFLRMQNGWYQELNTQIQYELGIKNKPKEDERNINDKKEVLKNMENDEIYFNYQKLLSLFFRPKSSSNAHVLIHVSVFFAILSLYMGVMVYYINK